MDDADACLQATAAGAWIGALGGGGDLRLGLGPGLVHALVAVVSQVTRVERLTGQTQQRGVVVDRVAPGPVMLGEQRADGRVVGEVTETALEEGPGLVDRHVRQQVAVVCSSRLLVQQVRNAQQRPGRRRFAQDLQLAGASQLQHRRRREFCVGDPVQGALEVWHHQQAALLVGAEGLGGGDALTHQRIGNRFTGCVAGVALEPVGIGQQAVAEHRLGLGVGHRCRREFLRKAGRVLRHVGEVRRVAALVEQRVDGARSAADLVRLGFGREVDLAGNPVPVLVVESGNRPVAETILVLALALEQVELHARAAVADAQALEALDPAPQALGEWQIRVDLARDITRTVKAQVPALGRVRAVRGAQLGQCAHVGAARARLEIMQDGKQLVAGHLLVLAHLVVKVVVETLRARKRIALAHDVQKAVLQHPVLELHQRVVRALARGFDPVRAQVG